MLIEFCSAEQPQGRRNAQILLGDKRKAGVGRHSEAEFDLVLTTPLTEGKLRLGETVPSLAANGRLSWDLRDISPKGYKVFAQPISRHISSHFSRTVVPIPGRT